VLALLALGIGGLPIIYGILSDARRTRQWRQLGLLAVPPFALAMLSAYVVLAGAASVQRAPHGTVYAPFTTLALVLQFGFVLLLLLAVSGSTLAIALAVRKGRLSERLVHFESISTAVVAIGMAAGLVSTVVLSTLILWKAPQLQGSPGILEVIILIMAGASVTALQALWRGWRTSHEQVA
jgi:MFS family permease